MVLAKHCWLVIGVMSLALAVKGDTRLVDDGFQGDEEVTLTFKPLTMWRRGQECSNCAVVPSEADRQEHVENETWRAITVGTDYAGDPCTMQVDFKGTGLTIYGFTPNDLGSNVFSKVNVSFALDGQAQGAPFIHNPESGNPATDYRVPYYNISNLSNTTHSVIMTVGGPSIHAAAWIDYAVIQYDSPPLSKSNTTGSIVGGVVGGVGGVTFLILLVIFLMKRRKRFASDADVDAQESKVIPASSSEAQLLPGTITPFQLSNRHSSTPPIGRIRRFKDGSIDTSLQERDVSLASRSQILAPADGGVAEEIRILRQETEQLRQQQHDIMQVVANPFPPMYDARTNAEVYNPPR